MVSLTLIWLQFAVCAVLIGLAGFQLSRYGDVIAHRTGLSGGWIGMALLATATSLPELVTGITSVTVADAPNLALGNALGSCNLNLFFLVVVDFLSRREPLWHRASQGHVLAAGFGVVMLGFVMVSLLVSHLSYPGQSPTPAFLANLGFSLATPSRKNSSCTLMISRVMRSIVCCRCSIELIRNLPERMRSRT